MAAGGSEYGYVLPPTQKVKIRPNKNNFFPEATVLKG